MNLSVTLRTPFIGSRVTRSGSIISLDRERMKHVAWFLIGFGVVLSFQTYFVSRYDWNWTVLVRVGAYRPHRELLEAQLGPVVCVDPGGHDGQINYLIARDPFNRHDTSSIVAESDKPPYRFRRILYPLLAGMGGLLNARGTVFGLVFWSAFGGGLIAMSIAALREAWHLPGIVVLIALLNPGIYLSAQVLTNDLLAMGLAMTGVLLWTRRLDGAAALVLACAVLVRETSILISLALALTDLRERGIRRSLSLLLFSGLPYLLWSLHVRRTIDGDDGLENITWPFIGLFEGMNQWHDSTRVVFGVVTLLLLLGSSVIACKTRNLLLRDASLIWIGLALLLSNVVWEHPGNALRAISPLWGFAALAYGTLRLR
jgi:hypothetical protein